MPLENRPDYFKEAALGNLPKVPTGNQVALVHAILYVGDALRDLNDTLYYMDERNRG